MKHVADWVKHLVYLDAFVPANGESLLMHVRVAADAFLTHVPKLGDPAHRAETLNAAPSSAFETGAIKFRQNATPAQICNEFSQYFFSGLITETSDNSDDVTLLLTVSTDIYVGHSSLNSDDSEPAVRTKEAPSLAELLVSDIADRNKASVFPPVHGRRRCSDCGPL